MEHLEFIGLQSQIPAGDTAVGVLQPVEGSVVRTEDEQPSLQVILQSTDHPLDSTPSRWCCIGTPSLTASVWRTVLGGQPPAPAETTPPLAPCSKHRSAGEKRQGNLPVALGQIQCHEKASHAQPTQELVDLGHWDWGGKSVLPLPCQNAPPHSWHYPLALWPRWALATWQVFWNWMKGVIQALYLPVQIVLI